MDKLKSLFSAHKITIILLVLLIILGTGGYLVFQKFSAKQEEGSIEEVDLPFDAEGPYALLFPRRDGNALVLNFLRTSSYDSISYELAYTSAQDETAVQGNKILDEGDSGTGEVIDRGVKGDIDTKEKKGEYEQEILFGTCSKNVCKYDKGVENGTLTLHIRKGKKAYRMNTQWHLQQPDIALGNLTSGDGHLVYKVDADRQTLSNVGFTIVNDLTGVPKLPSDKQVLGKVYSLNTPETKQLPKGDVSLELAENPPSGAKLYRYNQSKSEWQELDTKVESSKLSSKAEGAGIFAVLTSK